MSGSGPIYEYQREVTAKLEQAIRERDDARAYAEERNDEANNLQRYLNMAARERDEARAEVEGLQRSCERLTLFHKVALDRNDEVMKLCQEAVTQRDYFREKNRLAFRRGAEAMREAAATVVTSKESVWSTVAELAQSIRTLPVSEAPCKICGRHDQPHDPCDCAGEDKS